MKNLKKYSWFCNQFNNIRVPKIKFRDLDENHKLLYKYDYNLEEETINKATFFVFLIATFSSIMFLSFFTSWNLFVIFFCALLFSLLISYRFNIVLSKEINKRELGIDTMLILIKVNFSLIQKSYGKNADYCVKFIELMKHYRLPLSKRFELILEKVHIGVVPEKELIKLITPSEEFNDYIRNLIINKFNPSYNYDDFNDNMTEKRFKIYLKTIETKISIIFFLGLFFPIGLCFMILFQQVNEFNILIYVLIFLITVSLLFKKLIVVDAQLIGILSDNSKIEKKKFEEFLVFLNSFALYLSSDISPEKAFFLSYLHNKSLISKLQKPLSVQISEMVSLSSSFNEILNNLKFELKNVRYNILLETIKNIISENANYSSDKIFEILSVINKHRNLEKKLEVIINSEKFKAFIFVFLLPIIIGAIGGMIPILATFIKEINGNQNVLNYAQFFFDNLFYVTIIFLSLLLSNSISAYYFLKVINMEKKGLIIIVVNVIYTLIYYVSFFTVLNFF